MVSGYRTPIFLYSDLHGKRRKAGHTDPPLLFYFYRDRGVRNIESLYSRSTYEGGQREKKNDVSLARPRFGEYIQIILARPRHLRSSFLPAREERGGYTLARARAFFKAGAVSSPHKSSLPRAFGARLDLDLIDDASLYLRVLLPLFVLTGRTLLLHLSRGRRKEKATERTNFLAPLTCLCVPYLIGLGNDDTKEKVSDWSRNYELLA